MAMRVAELFAGVGGFRLGLPTSEYRTVWSNQWEPGQKAQWASNCYVQHFGAKGHSNVDIARVDAKDIPNHDLLVGGFPCQDYSVATTKAAGIQGKKGVLWWEIDRIVQAKRPKYVLLENVDRLLRSPTAQRGRDFGIVLRCLADAGYRVEWRAVNAADYGFPQKRRRVFIFAARQETPWGRTLAAWGATPAYLQKLGFFPRTFAVRQEPVVSIEARQPDIMLPRGVQATSDQFSFHFLSSGVALGSKVWTYKPHPLGEPIATLGGVLDQTVDEKYYIPDQDVPRWKYLKGAKAEARKAANGHRYHYSEGAIPFPDRLDQPSRTILTQEGAKSPSRFNHIIQLPGTNRYRRLTPEEVEKLDGFPPGWTKGMPERKRYFCMGNALVVGLVERMGRTLADTRAGPMRGLRAKRARIPKTSAAGRSQRSRSIDSYPTP